MSVNLAAFYSHDGSDPGVADIPSQLVTKIVIGQLPSSYSAAQAQAAVHATELDWLVWSELATRYPNLTHLHLWRVHGLITLHSLPARLQCLDIRHCPDLADIAPLAKTPLQRLILQGLPQISTVVGTGTSCPELHEFVVAACPQLHPHCLRDWLLGMPQLEILELADLPQLESIPRWADSLVDIRCHSCEQLVRLPERQGQGYWPSNLRRLELRDCAQLNRLAAFPPGLDYVDLGGMRQLTQLPEWQQQPRTLYLYGSGILIPPTFEHGSEPGDNVAESTRQYLTDRQEVGDGLVKRCKVIVLGNGGAGKTTLSLRLSGDDPTRTLEKNKDSPDYLDTTHGVIFHTIEGGVTEDVDVHLWDFGGQEIYHNTHRLFLSSGTIFLLLWDPEQDGRDQHQPLSYWLDYIDMACRPQQARVAIVCARPQPDSAALRKALRTQLGDQRYQQISHYQLDAVQGTGDLYDLQDWITRQSSEVVASQGTCVPSYWQLAQEMVERWVQQIEQVPEERRQSDPFTQAYQQMTVGDFEMHLTYELQQSLAQPERCTAFPELATKLKNKSDWLDADRSQRALRFLDNIGWVFWKPKNGQDLADSRVIIGQRWALDGIYTLLKRVDSHPDSPVYRELEKKNGIFTLQQLGEWGWNELGYQAEEQRLLLGYLRDNGLCFHLDKRDEHWWREEAKEYLCLSHLNSSPRDWDRKLDEIDGELHSDIIELQHYFHRGHWDQLLTAFGEKYGRSAEYTRDAILLKRRCSLGEIRHLITAQFHGRRLKGQIQIQTVEPEGDDYHNAPDEFHNGIHQFVITAMGDLTAGRTSTIKASDDSQTDPRQEKVQVFISYKRTDEENSAMSAPAKQVYRSLDQMRRVSPLLDEASIENGNLITEFMKKSGSSHYAIVMFSQAYFQSPYCIWELWKVLTDFRFKGEKYADSIVLIEQETFDICQGKVCDSILTYWQIDECDIPTSMKPLVRNIDELRTKVDTLVNELIPDLLNRKQGQFIHQYTGDIDATVSWIAEQVCVDRAARY